MILNQFTTTSLPRVTHNTACSAKHIHKLSRAHTHTHKTHTHTTHTHTHTHTGANYDAVSDMYIWLCSIFLSSISLLSPSLPSSQTDCTLTEHASSHTCMTPFKTNRSAAALDRSFPRDVILKAWAFVTYCLCWTQQEIPQPVDKWSRHEIMNSRSVTLHSRNNQFHDSTCLQVFSLNGTANLRHITHQMFPTSVLAPRLLFVPFLNKGYIYCSAGIS